MWVSKEKCALARKYDVLSYLKITDPGELVRVSRNEFCLRTHDSFRISNGKWHWWSRDIKGHTAVDYLVEVKGYSFPYAVNEVLRAMNGVRPIKNHSRKVEFKPPVKSESFDKGKEYLINRGIDETLIDHLYKSGLIYEDEKHSRLVFLGTDRKGQARHASYRAIDGTSGKGDAGGSDKKYTFSYGSRNSSTLHIFEGPIDLLSYITICIKSDEPWIDDDYLAVCGVYKYSKERTYSLPKSLEERIKENRNLKTVIIHFDGDDVGMSAARGIMTALEGRFEVINLPPQLGKDYNEYLNILRRKEHD